MRLLSVALMMSMVAVLAGCAGRAELIPNKDPALRKTSAEFAADAAKRHPYKASAPRGGQASARAQVGYVVDRLDIANNSDQAWTNVEIWMNGEYVVFLPVLEAKILKEISFNSFYNDKGQSFPIGNGKLFNREPVIVKKVELFRDGMLYDVPVQSAE